MKHSTDDVHKALAECRSYKRSTLMLVALGTMFKYCGASVDTGRAVKRISADGTVMPDPVTPDMMVQGRGLDVVVEIKAGFPSGAHARQKIFDQLRKYDCKLVGWMEKDVDVHDIMVVTRLQNSVEMSDYLQRAAAGNNALSNPLCVAEFAQLGGDAESFFIRTVSGNPTNKRLRLYMRNGAEISADSVVLDFNTFWFYDSEPHPPYTMSIICEKVLPLIAAKGAGGADDPRRETPTLCATVDEIMEIFHALAASARSTPRRRWIVKGMDGLVKIGVARKGADGAYIVDYSLIEVEDLLEVFVKKWINAQGGDPRGHA